MTTPESLSAEGLMTIQKPTIYRVDYYVQRPGSASRARFRLTGFVSQHLRGATTENAVLHYLRQKHPDSEIVLMSLEWK